MKQALLPCPVYHPGDPLVARLRDVRYSSDCPANLVVNSSTCALSFCIRVSISAMSAVLKADAELHGRVCWDCCGVIGAKTGLSAANRLPRLPDSGRPWPPYLMCIDEFDAGGK